MTTPACTCTRPAGAHDERCAWVKWMRSPEYRDDCEIPAFLRRVKKVKPSEGVFD